MIRLLASLFYLGYLPVAPGTAGALFGAAVYLSVCNNFYLYLAAAVSVLLCGFLVCGRAERIFGEKDSKRIVIDEAAGILVTFFLVKFSLANLAVGFLLYRLFDVLKPPPIWMLERLPGSYGIMLDDVMAGIYANLLLRALSLA